MAYTDGDMRDAAREFARAGGNIAKTVAALRAEPGLEKLSEATLRRMFKRSGWPSLVAEMSALLLDAEKVAAVEVERARAAREMQGTSLDRLAQDEVMLDTLRGKVEAALNDSNLKPMQAVQAFEMLTKIVDRRKDKVLIAIGTTRHAQLFVESIQEAVNSICGAGVAKRIFDAAKAVYSERSVEANEEEAA